MLWGKNKYSKNQVTAAAVINDTVAQNERDGLDSGSTVCSVLPHSNVMILIWDCTDLDLTGMLQ